MLALAIIVVLGKACLHNPIVNAGVCACETDLSLPTFLTYLTFENGVNSVLGYVVPSPRSLILIDFNSIPVRLISLALLAFSVAASGAEAPGTDREYAVNPEDVLSISVWNEPELQKTVTIRPDGGISFPLVGNVQVAGLTAEQLQSVLVKRLDAFVPDPSVTVTVEEINGMKVYVVGRVVRPGEYEIGRYVDVLQALTLAGGPTEFAARGKIKIIRKSSTDERVFRFNYKDVERGRKLEQNITLQSGDTIIVP